ncbi:hypothetical protein F2Q69_00052364 [Brassica cretica]|uniref:Uncharacterized protein n=1 Tax=Brassica cretica TaxID=69181 RepID=A0A8S9MUH6_BRACR|nr:hypothetical protein F2Q69_00052364 [Brassica cretica]
MVALGLIIASRSGCEFAVEPSTIFFSVWGDWVKDDAVVSIFSFFSCEDVTSFVLVDGLSWVHECPCVRIFDPLRCFALLEFQGLLCASVMLRVVILDIILFMSPLFGLLIFGMFVLRTHRLHFWKDINPVRLILSGFTSGRMLILASFGL